MTQNEEPVTLIDAEKERLAVIAHVDAVLPGRLEDINKRCPTIRDAVAEISVELEVVAHLLAALHVHGGKEYGASILDLFVERLPARVVEIIPDMIPPLAPTTDTLN